jgi:hydroxyacylglutathione hydrolase
MGQLKITLVPVTPFQQNCAVIWDDASKHGVVVDPGGDVPRIMEVVGQMGVAVARIVLTHGHVDHAAGAAGLKEGLERQQGGPVPIEGPDERDRFLLEGLERQGREYGLAGARAVTPDRWLVEGDEVRIADRAFAVLHCPGHTPGHIVLVSKELRFAVVGDVLFRGSVGRTDFPYGDGPALIESIRSKLLPLGDDMAFICGHGPGSTIGLERASNPFIAEIRG